ncbi:MAG: KH domain-containing protein [Microthrixaceae bacterium]
MSDADELDQDLDEADVNRIDDADDDTDVDDDNAVDVSDDGAGDEPAATAISVLDVIVCSLVDDPDAVRIDPIEQRDRVRLEVRVGPDEMGRVIGKRGRVANAIRTVVRAAAVRDDVQVDVEFED